MTDPEEQLQTSNDSISPNDNAIESSQRAPGNIADEPHLAGETAVAHDTSSRTPASANSTTVPRHSFADTFVHWWLLFVCSAVIVAAMLMSSRGEEKVFLPGFSVAIPELCYTRRMFGIDCPGCGLTRTFICLAHGDIQRAWHFHPAGILLFVIVAFQIPYRSIQLWRIYTGRNPFRIKHFEYLFYMLVIVMMTQWIARMFW